MKMLAFVSLIFLPLSFLCGIYGMNFEVFPGKEGKEEEEVEESFGNSSINLRSLSNIFFSLSRNSLWHWSWVFLVLGGIDSLYYICLGKKIRFAEKQLNIKRRRGFGPMTLNGMDSSGVSCQNDKAFFTHPSQPPFQGFPFKRPRPTPSFFLLKT